MKPLLERLHELGYVEGKNMTFTYRSPKIIPSGCRSWPRNSCKLTRTC